MHGVNVTLLFLIVWSITLYGVQCDHAGIMIFYCFLLHEEHN